MCGLTKNKLIRCENLKYIYLLEMLTYIRNILELCCPSKCKPICLMSNIDIHRKFKNDSPIFMIY